MPQERRDRPEWTLAENAEAQVQLFDEFGTEELEELSTAE